MVLSFHTIAERWSSTSRENRRRKIARSSVRDAGLLFEGQCPVNNRLLIVPTGLTLFAPGSQSSTFRARFRLISVANVVEITPIDFITQVPMDIANRLLRGFVGNSSVPRSEEHTSELQSLRHLV